MILEQFNKEILFSEKYHPHDGHIKDVIYEPLRLYARLIIHLFKGSSGGTLLVEFHELLYFQIDNSNLDKALQTDEINGWGQWSDCPSLISKRFINNEGQPPIFLAIELFSGCQINVITRKIELNIL